MESAGRPSRAALARCGAMVVPAAPYAPLTRAAVAMIPCDDSLDPQRFCVWWAHSWLATLVGAPAVLAFGCHATFTIRSRRPVTLAAVPRVLTCVGLRAASAPVY